MVVVVVLVGGGVGGDDDDTSTKRHILWSRLGAAAKKVFLTSAECEEDGLTHIHTVRDEPGLASLG